MNLKKVLNEDVVALDLNGTTKEEIIGSLLDILMETGKVKDREKAMTCLLAREAKNGVAIPHGKTDAVDELVACVAVKKEGIDFASLDGELSKIFIMTLSPEYRTGPHIQFLAEVGKLLKERAHREELLGAGSKKEMLEILTQ